MYSSLTAVVLCLAMQTAAAQCVAPAPVADHARPGSDLIKTNAVVAGSAPASTLGGGSLIKSATAGTHDDMVRPSRSASPTASSGDTPHRRGGPAMLFAALALMSGIALRRFGADKQ